MPADVIAGRAMVTKRHEPGCFCPGQQH